MHSRAVCAIGWSLRLYIVGQMVLNSVIVVHSFAIAYVSSLGTILNPVRRRRLPLLFYVRCPLVVAEVAWNVAGSVWSAQATSDCEHLFLLFVRASLTVSWLIVIMTLFGAWLMFDPLGNMHHDDFNLVLQNKRIWQSRLQTVFCCTGATSDQLKSALEGTAELLSFLFCDKDLVFTDLWAGIIILVFLFSYFVYVGRQDPLLKPRALK
ncbi:unnamed protein product [Soboliphyme baturini]|uniref:Solute carrier family 40 protein n=1 Tax=Soboliphyme baturini TaxID=241478 RepID=A0A183IR42_9BILA|nr:unnamed protein product [Soboliphyme baturini]